MFKGFDIYLEVAGSSRNNKRRYRVKKRLKKVSKKIYVKV